MFDLSATDKHLFEQRWRGALSEYVTALAWSSQGLLAASSATGEVMLWRDLSGSSKAKFPLIPLQVGDGQSVDCLGFSFDGQFLAAGGQDGTVGIWHLQPETGSHSKPLYTLENASAWVDQLAWSPTRNQLAFSIGRYVRIWDASAGEIVATLNFESSSALSMSWQPNGQHLAVAGNQGAKVWDAQDWSDDPYLLNMPAASIAIAWSGDSKYLASGNLDYTITVSEWNNPNPWVMRGFPGKIRNLAWSKPTTASAPVLAASSVEGIVVWGKQADDRDGWDARVLELHNGVVQGLAFQPDSLLLASAADDGWICLWRKAKQVAQILEGAPEGYSCLAWHPGGHQLAAGGQNGELLVWLQSKRGKGFG